VSSVAHTQPPPHLRQTVAVWFVHDGRSGITSTAVIATGSTTHEPALGRPPVRRTFTKQHIGITKQHIEIENAPGSESSASPRQSHRLKTHISLQ